jgi:hypothetical protein
MNAPPPDSAAAGSLVVREQEVWHVDPDQRAKRAACPEAKDNEIIVCAPKEDDPARDRLGPPIPNPPTAMEQLSEKLDVKLGPVDTHPASGTTHSLVSSPWVGVTLKLKF